MWRRLASSPSVLPLCLPLPRLRQCRFSSRVFFSGFFPSSLLTFFPSSKIFLPIFIVYMYYNTSDLFEDKNRQARCLFYSGFFPSSLLTLFPSSKIFLPIFIVYMYYNTSDLFEDKDRQARCLFYSGFFLSSLLTHFYSAYKLYTS